MPNEFFDAWGDNSLDLVQWETFTVKAPVVVVVHGLLSDRHVKPVQLKPMKATKFRHKKLCCDCNVFSMFYDRLVFDDVVCGECAFR